MPANYDSAAWFYDRLAALVFGNALDSAQQSLLTYISDNSKILIVGGGSGKILEWLAKTHSSALNITFIEISEKMTNIARKRNLGNNKVEFIIAAAEEVKLSTDYDIIITSFLFDNFNGETLSHLFNHINRSLKHGGIWLNTDFQLTGKWWQGFLLKSMLLFFRVLCGVQSKQLPDIDSIFRDGGYELFDKTTFYGEFIVSTAYCKK